MYAQKRQCGYCGKKFNYRGGHRLCPQCKQSIKKSGLSLTGMPGASPSRRHQCGKCLGKNLVTEPGMLCEDCFPTEVESELKYTGTSIIGCIGYLLLLPCILYGPVFIIMFIKGVVSAEDVIKFGLLFFFGILAIKYSLDKKDEARANVFKKVEAAHAFEVSRIESLIGFASHDGANSKKSGEYFVYLHYFPDLNQVVYVGKGKNSRDQEEIRTNPKHTDLLKRGKLKVHRVLTRVSERVAFEQESFLIGLFGRKSDGGQLFNVQGGDRLPKNHLPSLKKRNISSIERSRAREFNSLDECLGRILPRNEKK